MKQARFKIYKQVGIQELVPHKYNIKLFKHLLIAKYTFLYFFFRSYVSSRYNKVKLFLKPFVAPFIYPDVREVFDNYEELDEKKGLSKINTRPKKRKFLSFSREDYIKDFKQFAKRHSSYYVKPLITQGLHKEESNYVKLKRIPKYSKYLPISGSRYFKPLSKHIYLIRPRSYKLKPHRSFKSKYTKIPKLFTLAHGDLLAAPFPTNDNSVIPFRNINYSTNPKAFQLLLLNLHKLYIKFSQTKLHFVKERFFMSLSYKYIMHSLITFYKTFKKYVIRLYTLFHNIIKEPSLTDYNIAIYFLLRRIKFTVQQSLTHFLSQSAVLKYNSTSYLYSYFHKLVSQHQQFGMMKRKLLGSLDHTNLDNLGWYGLMEFLFPKFFQSGDNIYMRKYYVDRYIINPLIYRKYLGELSRSETLKGFTRTLMNYKQKRDIRKFFFKLNKKRFGRARVKRYHDLGSYYKMTHKLLSVLLNRQSKGKRKYAFFFNSYRIKLFQIKLYKVLFSFKRSKDCLPLLNDKTKLNKLFEKGSNINSPTQLSRWINDIKNNTSSSLAFYKNGKITNSLGSNLLGDVIQVRFKNELLEKTFSLPVYNKFISYRLLHFYLNAFKYFKSGMGPVLSAFGKYNFLLEATLYKFGFILIKHVLYFIDLYTSSHFKLLKMCKSLPIMEQTSLSYVPIDTDYIRFDTNPMYVGSPVNLPRANLNAYFDYKLSLYSGQLSSFKKDPRLDFLNFFYYKVPYHQRIAHNRYHIVRYVQFIRGLKEFISFNLNTGFLISKYSLIISSTKNESLLDLDGVLKDIREKLHSNKVDKLLLGSTNSIDG